MMSLENKSALITGAGRGIGKTTARFLAEKGMLVEVNDVNAHSAEEAAAVLRAARLRALALPGSVADSADMPFTPH